MKSLIRKYTSISEDGKTGRMAIYILGICIYSHEYPEDIQEKPRRIGFVQYPNEAPGYIDEDWEEEYYPEEF